MNYIESIIQNKTKILGKIYASISEEGGACGVDGEKCDPMTTGELVYCLKSLGFYCPNKTFKYLEQSQDKLGKWTDYSEDAWEVSITSWVLLALGTAENRNWAIINKGIAWLQAMQGEDGGFRQSDEVAEENTYATAYACLALHCIDSEKYDSNIRNGIRWLKNIQNDDGGFGRLAGEKSEASLTAYVAHFFSSIDAEQYNIIQAKDGIIKYLINSQRNTGAWTSWFELDDSVEGTSFTMYVLLNFLFNNTELYENGCRFLSENLNIKDIDNWICFSLLYMIIGLENVKEGN